MRITAFRGSLSLFVIIKSTTYLIILSYSKENQMVRMIKRKPQAKGKV
jgi:hypothetical protein